MGGSVSDAGNSITADASGNIYTTGNFYGTVDFDPEAGITDLTSAGLRDIFIQKLSQCSPTTGTDVITACEPYAWIDGNTYATNNNAATWTLTNAGGCDSVVTLDLTINQPTTGDTAAVVCNSFDWYGNTLQCNRHIYTYAYQFSWM